MGGNGVGLDSGGGSRGASFGGLGMRAIFSPFGLVHHKPDAQPRPRGGFGWTMQIPDRPPSRDHIKPRSKGYSLDGNRALVWLPL